MAVLEDPHQGAEGRAEGQGVHGEALSGTSTEPVIRNSRTKVASAISASAQGSRVADLLLEVDQEAALPVT